MLKLKKKLLILLLSFLSISCGCIQIPDEPEAIEYPQHILKDGYCLRRQYHEGMDFNGPLENVYEVDISECAELIGLKPDNYKKKVKRDEESRIYFQETQAIKDQLKNKSK